MKLPTDTSALWPLVLALASLGPLVTARPLQSEVVLARADALPTYSLVSSTKLTSRMGADISASSFVGRDGQFHLMTSVADYEDADKGGSFTRIFSNDDFGKLVHEDGSTTTMLNYNSYWNRPGTMCYQLDKRANRPMPSLYQDDHCDIVGTWLDPATGDWYGIVNDEYQFDPWTADATQNARIATGRHNNRVLLAHSSNEGKDWDIVDQICTDKYQPDQTIKAEHFPGQTYSWGLSGTRIFIDYSTGYAYGLFNHQIRWKSGDATIAKWFTMARAPLTDKLAPESWRKYHQGKYDQPGIGGIDGMIGEPLGLDAVYEPTTDLLAFRGKGADGSDVSFELAPFPAGGIFNFTNADGAVYHVNVTSNVITDAAGAAAESVSYHDPAQDLTISIGPTSSTDKTIKIVSTDKWGTTASMLPKTAHSVFKDAATNRLYVIPDRVNENRFVYDVATGKYISVGYSGFVFELEDLSKPNEWTAIGSNPPELLSRQAYNSLLDSMSLTGENVAGRLYAVISDLYISVDTVSVPENAGFKDAPPHDDAKQPIDTTSSYGIKVGTADLPDSTTWQFEDVPDPVTKLRSGFYRLKSESGKYLQTSGATVQEQRKWGAPLVVGDKQPDTDLSGNGGFGSPGGSDQWYLLPIGANTPKAVDGSSSPADIEAAHKTSLKDAVGYKLVNHQSGLAVQNVNGQWQTVPNDWAQNANQQLHISKH